MAQPPSIFAYMKEAARHIVRMRDVKFEPSLFQNYLTGTALDELLCSYKPNTGGVRSVSGFTMISALKVMCFMMKSDSGRISRYGVSSQRHQTAFGMSLTGLTNYSVI